MFFFRWLRRYIPLSALKTLRKGFFFPSTKSQSLLKILFIFCHYFCQSVRTQWNHLFCSLHFCSHPSDWWCQLHNIMYMVCYFTFCAVCGVVQRWRVAIEVRRHLDRWAPDPVETIAKGDLIPTTSPTLEVTLWGWMRELGLAETGMVLETGDLTSKFMSSSSGAFSQITRSRSAYGVCQAVMKFLFFWEQG